MGSEAEDTITAWLMADTGPHAGNKKQQASQSDRSLEERIGALREELGNPDSLFDALRYLFVGAVLQRNNRDWDLTYQVLNHKEGVIAYDPEYVQKMVGRASIAQYLRESLSGVFKKKTVNRLMPFRKGAPLLTYRGFEWHMINELYQEARSYWKVAKLLNDYPGIMSRIHRDRDSIKHYAPTPQRFLTLEEVEQQYVAYAMREGENTYDAGNRLALHRQTVGRRLRQARALVGEEAWSDGRWRKPFAAYLQRMMPNGERWAVGEATVPKVKRAYQMAVYERFGKDISRAARAMGIARQTLSVRLKEWGVTGS